MPIIPQPFLTLLTKFWTSPDNRCQPGISFLPTRTLCWQLVAPLLLVNRNRVEKEREVLVRTVVLVRFGERQQMDLLLIGLGGGALPKCVNMSIKYIPNVSCISLYMYAVLSSGFHIGLFDVSFFIIYLPVNT